METTQTAPETAVQPAAPETETGPIWTAPKKRPKWRKRLIVLLVIAALGVAVSKVIPLKLPVVAYVSIIGLLAACPVSPCREFVINAAGKINFTAPLTMVGAYAGISISDQIRSFLKQGWKMILVGVFVMTGTFVGSALIAHVVLKITGAI